ncbi:MAG: transglutaminase-like family protein [Leptolyngbya sp. SIOISBB]|nr:transglutaminase-like family protein [Leptolyngbya sp. SIOISBB]
MPPFTQSQWTSINALGRQVDQQLETAQVGLTMGGEPTYVAASDRTDLQWRYQALGAEKRRLAGELLSRLETRLAYPGSLRHYGLGKLYPGETYPRWALGCFWRPDGQLLWRNPDLLADEQATTTQPPGAVAESFIQELTACLAIPPAAIIPAYELGEKAPAGFVLPLLTTEVQGMFGWQSCRWTGFDQGIILLPGEASVGLRLPLTQITASDQVLTEAHPAFSSDPIRPEQSAPLAADDSIRLALVVSIENGIVQVFLPPIAAARSFADVITAIEATAEVLDQPVQLAGYGPPSNQGIEGFRLTPDPGVLEVNIHPARSWEELVRLHVTLDEAAIACGLACEKYGSDGQILGTGGGSHITIGGPTPATSPLLKRPDLLRSLLTYWQHHPSLSYVFAGQYIGPTSQTPRVDEARHDSLYELELAFLSLVPGKVIEPEIVDRLLSPLLQDVAGSTHRTALCIDKLYPLYNPAAQLGLLEFRGFEMPPYTGLRLLQMLLIRALVARFWQQPFTQPLQRWGADLRDRWLLPHYLIQDFQVVLKELKTAGLAFDLDWFTSFLLRRFPQIGKISLLDNPSRVLELRTALEPWPVIGDAGGSGTSRPVDNSLERLQLFLTGAVGDPPAAGTLAERYAILCNGYRVPLRSTGVPGDYVGAVRFRARAPMAIAHAALAPHTPLRFEVIDTWQSQFLGGILYVPEKPDQAATSPLPKSPEEARSRLKQRFTPLTNGPVPAQLPPLLVHPETPMTLDLRLAAQRST